jgi:DNA invertase Pin-like site-specific DNA recombinase
MTNDQGTAPNPQRAAIYARTAVSQDGYNYVIASQIEQCKAYCQEHGYVVEEGHIYTEECNGMEDYQQHSELMKALQAIAESVRETEEKKAREERASFKKFIVTSFDRLSRDPAQVAAIIEELQKHGVTVESIDGYDLDDAAQFRQAIMQGVTQIEREQFTRRMKHGKQAARKRREQEQQQ